MIITEANSSQLKSQELNTKISKAIYIYFQTLKITDKMLIKILKSNKDKLPLCQQLSEHKILNPPEETVPANSNKPSS